ncbi:hypothetical protein Salat_0132300 [Sesamum alatum]|uniref:Uncharacterized protein n=1 Tax=Sesamum alatum TaxID=300844 RepID=A0AAE1YXB9_9LAMI|nr:hypothetical protein Salat_0132300 [Sesamum alatum]
MVPEPVRQRPLLVPERFVPQHQQAHASIGKDKIVIIRQLVDESSDYEDMGFCGRLDLDLPADSQGPIPNLTVFEARPPNEELREVRISLLFSSQIPSPKSSVPKLCNLESPSLDTGQGVTVDLPLSPTFRLLIPLGRKR